MKKTVKMLALALAAMCTALVLTGCSLDFTGGKEEEDPLTRAATAEADVVLPEDMNAEAQFATKMSDSGMYVVFNGINDKKTDYFKVPSGSLTIDATATGEATGMKSFKINLWQKQDGSIRYVDGTTIYYYTDGTPHTYTISGLDPEAEYRLAISYDAYKYYIYGKMFVSGAAA